MPALYWHVFSYGKIKIMNTGGEMKLAIIYPDQEGWTVDQFRESAGKRGVAVQTVEVTDDLLASREVDKQIADVDAVLWKFANATLAGFLASYPILKDKVLINTGVVLMPSATDKFLQQQLLLRSDLHEYALATYRVNDAKQVESLVEGGVLQYPLIIKPAWGTNAQGVHIISSAEDMEKITTWKSQIAEPFIPSTEEWRVFVVGGVAAGMMKKHRRDNADPSRTIIGGGARNVAETDERIVAELSGIAERVAALFHLEYAGIDIVRDQQTGQFHVYEANSAAGWQNGFVEATGEDIPGQVLDWFSERVALQHTEDVATAVRRYLIARSHRLPLIDELLLLSELIIAQPESTLIERRQQLMGVDYDILRHAIRQELTINPDTGRQRVKDLLKSIRRYHTVEMRVIVGDELFDELFQDPGDNVTETADLVERVRQLVDSGDVASIEDLDRVVGRQFAVLPLAELLDFAVAARRVGGQSRLEDAIRSRAEASVSWAGNFLIDKTDPAVGVSTLHTMRQGYLQSVRYLQLVSLINRQDLRKQVASDTINN